MKQSYMDRQNSANHECDMDGRDIENDQLMDWKETETTASYIQPLLLKRVNTTSQIAIVGANVCPIESLDYE